MSSVEGVVRAAHAIRSMIPEAVSFLPGKELLVQYFEGGRSGWIVEELPFSEEAASSRISTTQ